MNRRIRNRTYGGVGGREPRGSLLPDGAVLTWAIWYLGPKWSQFSGARIIVLTLAGGVLLVCGLATVISPPTAEYKSPANKQRNAILGAVGIALAAVELYFYNDIYGIW